MRAEVALGEERERLWEIIDEIAKGGFEEMQKKTTREFPVVELSLA